MCGVHFLLLINTLKKLNVDGLVRFGQNTSGTETSHCARIMGLGFWQNATSSLPVSCFQTWLHSFTDSPDPIWFWLTVSGFSQRDSVWKQASVQESSGPLLANASEPIWTGCKLDLACLLGKLRQGHDFYTKNASQWHTDPP